MKNKEVIIYPFNSELVSFVKAFWACENEYELRLGCTLPGTGLMGQVYDFMVGKDKYQLKVTGDSEEEMKQADIVLVPYTELALENRDKIYERVLKLLKLGKRVICNISFGLERDKELLQGESASLFTFGEMSRCKNIYGEIGSRMSISKVPIILIGEIFPYKQERSSVLSVSRYFKEDYKVVEIGGCQFSDLLGQYNMPAFMFDSNIIEDEKVIKFNHFVRDIVEKENADLVVIDLPDAPVRYKQNINLNGYGILSYIISKAVLADGFILTIPCNLFQRGIIDKLKDEIKNTYRVPIIGIDINNIYCFENVEIYSIPLSEDYFKKMYQEQFFESKEYEIISSYIDEMSIGKCIRRYLEEESNENI